LTDGWGVAFLSPYGTPPAVALNPETDITPVAFTPTQSTGTAT
jgi:hypothetical protein